MGSPRRSRLRPEPYVCFQGRRRCEAWFEGVRCRVLEYRIQPLHVDRKCPVHVSQFSIAAASQVYLVLAAHTKPGESALAGFPFRESVCQGATLEPRGESRCQDPFVKRKK